MEERPLLELHMLGVAGRLNGVGVAFFLKHNPILAACNLSLHSSGGGALRSWGGGVAI